MKLTSNTLNALVPAPDTALAVSASEEQLRQLQLSIRATMGEGETAMKQLREMCGGEATGVAGELMKRFNFGLAQFRDCDATLCRMWRAKNSRERQPQAEGVGL